MRKQHALMVLIISMISALHSQAAMPLTMVSGSFVSVSPDERCLVLANADKGESEELCWEGVIQFYGVDSNKILHQVPAGSFVEVVWLNNEEALLYEIGASEVKRINPYRRTSDTFYACENGGQVTGLFIDRASNRLLISTTYPELNQVKICMFTDASNILAGKTILVRHKDLETDCMPGEELCLSPTNKFLAMYFEDSDTLSIVTVDGMASVLHVETIPANPIIATPREHGLFWWGEDQVLLYTGGAAYIYAIEPIVRLQQFVGQRVVPTLRGAIPRSKEQLEMYIQSGEAGPVGINRVRIDSRGAILECQDTGGEITKYHGKKIAVIEKGHEQLQITRK